MDDDKGNWKHFQRPRFDSKNVSRRMRRAETATTKHARKFIFHRLNNIREVRREIITWLVVVGVMIGAVVIQLAWFSSAYLSTAAAEGGSYSEGSLGPIQTLDPLYATSDAEQTVSRLVFSSLYQYDTSGHLNGDLAVSRNVDKTGKIYTVNLRSDARWQDDVAVTADDIAFTIKLIKNPSTRTNLEVNWRDITVKVIDSTTIQFILPSPYAAFPQALTFPVLPEHILRDVSPGALRQSQFSSSPIGSGPFKFVLSQTALGSDENKIVHLAANQQYYGGAPKLGHFDVHSFTDDNEIVRALKTGEINAATSLTPDKLEGLSSRHFVKTTKAVDSGVYALFNNNNAILKDKKVRSALRLAIDTGALRKELAGNPPDLHLPFINGQLGDESTLTIPAANQAQAAKQLTAAGWKLSDGVRSKKSMKLQLTITTTKNTQYQKAAKIIADDWRAIGVTVNINVVDTNDPNSSFAQNVLRPRNFDVLLYELVIGADPDVYAYWDSSQIGMDGYNFSNYDSIVADATLSSARSTLDTTARYAKYRAFASQWLRDVPAVGLYQATTSYVVNRSAAALDPSGKLVSPNDRFANVLYWSSDKKTVYKTP